MQPDKYRILIIDDDPSLGRTLADILRVKGYETITAKNGTEGLAFLGEHAVSLALVDLGLPDIPGLEVLNRIKSSYPSMEVIILTGNATLDSAIEATNHGAFFYLVKPYEIDQLLLHIRRAIEKQQVALELKNNYEELKATQAQILQSEKMASIGQLAAGVAHEINNPIGFVSSNLSTLDKYVTKMVDFLSFQEEKLQSNISPEILLEIEERKKRLKLGYIMEDARNLIQESLEGTDRVRKIVQDLKTFSRMNEAEQKLADINECLESTINIAWNEIKYKATLSREYGEIPTISCYPQELAQVFLNLLVNAAHAIEKQGEITVRSWSADGFINIAISDTGCGIPDDIQSRIFEPFFTTKEVGLGTGLGLSISYGIVKKHNGEISVRSEAGAGTTFTVRLPVREIDDGVGG